MFGKVLPGPPGGGIPLPLGVWPVFNLHPTARGVPASHFSGWLLQLGGGVGLEVNGKSLGWICLGILPPHFFPCKAIARGGWWHKSLKFWVLARLIKYIIWNLNFLAMLIK